jgi:signal peptidase I
MVFRQKKKSGFWKKLDPFTYVDDYVLPKVNPKNNEMINWIVYLVFSFVFAFIIYSFIGFVLQTASPLVIVVSSSMLPTLSRGDVVLLQGTSGDDLAAPEVELDFDIGEKGLSEYAVLTRLDGGGLRIDFPSVNKAVLVPRKGSTDIVVYTSKFKNLEIIHRAVVKINANDGFFVLTKGDNNPSLDQDCGVVEKFSFPGTDSQDVSTTKSCPSPFAVPLSQVNGKALGWVPFIGYVKLWIFDAL